MKKKDEIPIEEGRTTEETQAVRDALEALGIEKWKTEDGRELAIHEMEDKHLLNCIRKIVRSSNWRWRWHDRLYAEAKRRGLDV